MHKQNTRNLQTYEAARETRSQAVRRKDVFDIHLKKEQKKYEETKNVSQRAAQTARPQFRVQSRNEKKRKNH